MIFIDKDGIIVYIEQNTIPLQTSPTYSSIYPAKFVLEVNAGWCERNSVVMGNVVDISDI